MRKWIFFAIIILFIVAGGGYLGFQFYKKAPSSVTTKSVSVEAEAEAEDENVEKVKVSDEESKTPIETNVETDKVWEFSFGDDLDASTVNSENISVKDVEGNTLPIKSSLINNRTIQISPPEGGYKKGATYYLNIKNGISYANGSPVSKPYNLRFMTDREKSEKVKLSKKVVMVKQNQVEFKNSNTLEVDRDIDRDLKIGEILVISDKKPNGQALKIESVDEKIGAYQVTVTKPHFYELFDEIDIYNTYTIDAKNIKLAKGIEGTSIEPIAASIPNTLISATNDKNSNLENMEYNYPQVTSSFSKKKGVEIKLDHLPLRKGKAPVYFDGSLRMYSPVVNVESKATGGKAGRIVIGQRNENEMTGTLKVLSGLVYDRKEGAGVYSEVNAKTGKVKEFDQKTIKEHGLKKPFKKKILLATADIPIPSAPYVQVGLGIYINVNVTVAGELKVTASYEYMSEKGVIIEKNHKEPYKKGHGEGEFAFQGKGEGEVKSGILSEVTLRSFDIAAAGVEGFAGSKIKGEAMQGALKDKGDYFCNSITGSVVGNANVFVDLQDAEWGNNMERIFEYQFPEHKLSKSKTISTCDSFESIRPIKGTIELSSNEKQDLMPMGKYIDLLTLTNHYKRLKKTSNFDISYSTKGVVKVEKIKDDRLVVKALNNPSADSTELRLKYTIKDKAFDKTKTSSIKIPVKIKDYGQHDYLKGEWSFGDQYGGSTLNILDVNNKKIKFEINASVGGHANGYEGTAIIKDNKALFVDKGSQCHINFFVDKKDTITLHESSECNIKGVPIEGEYKKGEPKIEVEGLPEVTLGAISESQDQGIRELVGDDYNLFVQSTQQYVPDGEDLDGWGASVVTGGVAGLYTLNEAIYMVDTSGDLFLAVIVDGKKVRFYTNNELYQDKLPLTIENWMSRFSDYPVEYKYKKIAEY